MPTPAFTFRIVSDEDGSKTVTAFVPRTEPLAAADTHPNFQQIVSACFESMTGREVSVDEFVELFDVGKTVESRFRRLSERVTVRDGQILLDGDPVDGALQRQIIDFLDAGEDFAPLVNFYEKLLTNPLGDVRDGLFDWIKGQRENGNFTITPDGDILGYKSVCSTSPEWRTDEEVVYVASRRSIGGGETVNGVEVKPNTHIEQVPGDLIEMPRSQVLHEPSRECGVGLHIGTYSYAQDFIGDTVMLVQFSPRDIVSMPDNNSSWKLRVCRYTVVEPVDGPLDVPVYQTGVSSPVDEAQETKENVSPDFEFSRDNQPEAFQIGDRVIDEDGDQGVVVEHDTASGMAVKYDDPEYGTQVLFSDDAPADGFLSVISREETPSADDQDEKESISPDIQFNRRNQPESFQVGDRVVDFVGDEGTIVAHPDGGIGLKYDNAKVANGRTVDMYGTTPGAGFASVTSRPHGKGGPTSQSAKGNGRNPAQDKLGRFSSGRPGSRRDPNTGRFVG